jgi:hypothetical protein
MGAGDCILQDIADDGTIACIPGAIVVEEQRPGPATTVLRIVFSDGAQHDVSAAPFMQGCGLGTSVLFGNVSLSTRPDLVSLTRWCQLPPKDSATLIDTWIIGTETLNRVRVSVTGLGATGWSAGTTTLVASGDVLCGSEGTPNTPGTSVVTADGNATKLTSAEILPRCFAHH